MPRTKKTTSAREPFLPVLRALAETYTAVMSADARSVRKMDLTSCQFDVIATLGNTDGITAGELSRRTLVTKGTLTGVIDRLESRGLVERVPSARDRRSVSIRLTARGEALFDRVFPAQMDYLRPYFERALNPSEMDRLRGLLMKLKESFEENAS